MNNIYNFIKNIVKAIPVLNTILSSDLKSNNVQLFLNKNNMKKRSIISKSSLLFKNKFYESVTLFKNFYSKIDSDKIINYLLNNNYFYFILTIISLLFSIFISLNIGSYFVGFIFSFWIYYKNNNSNLLGIIITISFIVIYYYLTGIIYCEGGDSDINTPSGDNTNTSSGDNTNTSSGDSTRAVILESKDHYHITKEDFNKGVEFISQNIRSGIESVIPNLGAASAAGAAATAVINKSNLPTLPKLALTGITAAVVGAGTKIGIAAGDSLLDNKARNESVTPSIENISNTGDEIQSPVNDFIHSVLEKGDMLTPLEELLKCQLGLNVLMLVEIFILIMILYNKLFINSSFSIFNKYLYPKLGDSFKSFFNKMNSFNDKFFYIIFIINCLCLIFAIFLSFIIIGSLNTNLQEYIDVYNQIKK